MSHNRSREHDRCQESSRGGVVVIKKAKQSVRVMMNGNGY